MNAEEVILDLEKITNRLRESASRECPICSGIGLVPLSMDEDTPCENCNGTGRILEPRRWNRRAA